MISSKLQTDVTTNVVTGKADVFYADSPVAGYAIAQTDGQLEMLGKVEGIAPEGIVIKKATARWMRPYRRPCRSSSTTVRI